MDFIKISIAILLFLFSWAILFRTGLIFKINSWIRENIFADNVILFSRRRMAILLMILGLIALFSGIDGLVDDRKIQPRIAAEMIELAATDYQKQRYEFAIKRCRDVVRSDPKNIEAWRLLAASWWAMGEKSQAWKAVQTIRQVDETYPVTKDPLLAPIRSK